MNKSQLLTQRIEYFEPREDIFQVVMFDPQGEMFEKFSEGRVEIEDDLKIGLGMALNSTDQNLHRQQGERRDGQSWRCISKMCMNFFFPFFPPAKFDRFPTVNDSLTYII